jgi:hypothetical protein
MPTKSCGLLLALLLPSPALAQEPPPPAASLAPAPEGAIHLRCLGTATFKKADHGLALSILLGAGDGTKMGVEEEVLVDLAGDQRRVRIPSVMLPPMHGASEGGWLPLENLNLGEREISGSFALNVVNHPKIRIDRGTGRIEIVGAGAFGFHGNCQSHDPDAPRKF